MLLIKLILAFTLIPLVELYLLLQLAEATSIWVTIATVISTGILGSVLAKREGAIAWQRFRESIGLGGDLSQARFPGREIQDGLMIAFAAALLLTPGLVTDTVGFTLLFPRGREFMRKHILPRLFRSFRVQVQTSRSPNPPRTRRSDTIDAAAFERKA
ncbi:phage T7 F exclusion suppressor FxsA [Rubripirellula amarantea]|uniref:Phage T7 F exclusion suppressor FxsA n=1 Tax=Rubripirellula amarantea TaxID=2527999 RepID=A0A5C5WML4_9BACT|nr:FxsA family protein [Rubripirellula amarantea]TWT51329.1 phage T7 F exclusion suppressor FxsA [Rubripirellula amarantea]